MGSPRVIGVPVIVLALNGVGGATIGEFFPMETLAKAANPQVASKSKGIVQIKGVGKPNGTIGLLGLAQLAKPRAKAVVPTAEVERLTLSDPNGVWPGQLEGYRVGQPTGRSANVAAYIVPKTAEDHSVYVWSDNTSANPGERVLVYPSGQLKEIARFAASQMKPGSAVRLPMTLSQIGRQPIVIVPRSKEIAGDSAGATKPLLLAETPLGKLARFSFTPPVDIRPERSPWGAPFTRHEQQPAAFFLSSPTTLELGYVSKDGTLKLARMRPGSPFASLDLPVFHGEISSMTRSDNGDIYYFTFAKGKNPTASLVRCGLDGTLLARVDLGNSEKEFDLLGLSGTTSSLVIAPGGILLTSSRGLQSGHQSSFAAAFHPKNLSLLKNFGQSCSHSFANRAFFERDYFITADLGDNYPRGIVLHRLGYERVGRVVFTYKTQHENRDETNRTGENGIPLKAGRWSNDNGTYTRLGDILPTKSGYLVLFTGEQSTDNDLARSSHNEPHNVGLVLVRRDFQRVPQIDAIVPPSLVLSSNELSKPFGFFDYGGGYTRQQNAGVIWLTSFSDKSKENAAQVRAVNLDKDRILVVWEVWSDRQYRETHAIVINEFGRPLGKLMNLGSHARIPDGARLELRDGYVLWPAVRAGSLDVFAWKIAE